jgi:protein SCO1/2
LVSWSVRTYRLAVSSAAVFALLLGCAPSARHYPLKGQVLAVDASVPEVTVRHEDIPGFMPAMTMAYRVPDRTLLDGLTPGDLITATLVVRDTAAHLEEIRKVGHADVATSQSVLPKVMDVLEPGDTVPDEQLIDQDGRRVRLSAWRGKALAVTFIYTRCPLPDFCPLMDRRFAAVQKKVAADAELRDGVHLVSVTFDPTHDTPDVLKPHAASVGADPAVWSFLTGPPEAIAKVSERFGVSAIQESDAIQSITHNLRTAVIDPRGRLVAIYTGRDWTPDQLVEALREARARR